MAGGGFLKKIENRIQGHPFRAIYGGNTDLKGFGPYIQPFCLILQTHNDINT
jgi:hypothetical protein